jgi:hypothetical protein
MHCALLVEVVVVLELAAQIQMFGVWVRAVVLVVLLDKLLLVK